MYLNPKENEMKRTLAFILAITLLSSNISLADFSIKYHLSHGLTYTETTGKLDDGKDNHTYVFEYTPSLSTLPIVVWGESQKSRKTLLKMAEPYIDNAVAGINGDFFSFYTGIPMGCLVSQGRFLSSSVDNNALVIMEDGTLQIGKPDIKSTISFKDEEFDFYYNKYPLVYSLYLTDSTYSDSTGSDFDCLEVVLCPEDENLYINSSTPAVVVSIYTDKTDTKIREGHFVLTVPKTHEAYKTFSKLHIGESVTINVTGSELYDTAKYIIGGGDILVENGEFIPESVNEYSDRARNARTAVGIREDGSGIFFAVNSKKEGYSSGMNFEEVANTLISMGAKTVLNLDGGGSTTVAVKLGGSDKLEVKNYSSDGYPRAVSNAILFLNNAEPDGVIANTVLLPDLHFALPNSLIDIKEVFSDASMTKIENALPLTKVYTPLSQGLEIVDGKMKIGDGEYERTLSASYYFENEKSFEDTKTFYVPEKLDSITISAEKQVLDRQDSTFISVFAEYSGFEVYSSHDAFNWYFSENNKESLEEGVLAENDIARLTNDGKLTIITEDTFVSTSLFAEYNGTVTELAIYVGYPDTPFEIPQGDTSVKIPLNPKSFKIRLEGKYSSPCFLTLIDSQGEEIKLEYAVSKDYSEVTGYTELEATLLDTVAGNVFLKTAFESEESDRVVNDFTVSYGFESNIFDDTEENWAKEYIKSIYDMGLISGYQEDGKTLFAPDREITRAEFSKLVTLFEGLEVNEENENITFNDSDIIPLWAEDYVQAVAQNSVMNGRREDDGTLSFAPTSPITRTEVMIVISRIIGEREGIELSFSDSDTIPEWAKTDIAKVVSSGIITGYPDNTLRHHNNITRAEVAVVFSRLYEYLYPKEEISTEEIITEEIITEEVTEDVQSDSLEVCP